MESHDSTAANEPQAVAQAEQPGDSVELNATNASATDVEKEATTDASATDVEKEATTDASATDVEKEANAANEDPATATESTAENNANEDSVDRNDLSDSAWTFGSPLASTAASPVGDASATASDLADDVPQPPSPTSVPATESEPGPPSPKSAGEALPVEPSAAHVDEPVHVEEEEQGEVPQSSESPVVPTQEDPSEGIDTQPPQTQGTPRKKYPYADVRNFISASMTAEDIATLKLWRLEKDEREKQWWKERKATLREAAKEDPECTFTPHITAHPQHENEDGNTPNVHARLQAEGAFRKERMEKLIAKYEKQEAEDFKKLSFKPDITPHPIHSGDQYNNSTITPFDRMYEDFKQRCGFPPHYWCPMLNKTLPLVCLHRPLVGRGGLRSAFFFGNFPHFRNFLQTAIYRNFFAIASDFSILRAWCCLLLSPFLARTRIIWFAAVVQNLFPNQRHLCSPVLRVCSCYCDASGPCRTTPRNRYAPVQKYCLTASEQQWTVQNV